MKIYRLQTIWPALSLDVAQFKVTLHPGSHVQQVTFQQYGPNLYAVVRRAEFLREHHIDGKTLARLLPSWAKHKKLPNIGAKVTAFYAENDKVVTRLHHSGFVVGSDDYADWLETQPDPFRSCREYRQSLGERIW